MSIQLETKDLINAQEMEVAVNGPDGATYLILCTGIVELGALRSEDYTFLVGPQLSRRQFVNAIASGALSTIQSRFQYSANGHEDISDSLILINADYDDKFRRVKVNAELSSGSEMTKIAISYYVSILAELSRF
jgi:hypothetical protein